MKTKFRPYCTTDYFATLGEIPVCLNTNNSAVHSTAIYVVQVHKVESLLGDENAKALGILTINKGGYTPLTQQQATMTDVANIQANLQASGIPVQSTKDPDVPIPPDEQARVQALIDKHPTAFSGIGLLKDEEVSFHIDQKVPPVAAPYRPIPLAYREKLSSHLQALREENKIEDVDPNEHCPWISNVVITEMWDKSV
jgi:hypothetical protein